MRRLALLLLLPAILVARPDAPEPVAARVTAVEGLAVTVSDLERSVRFYVDVLGFSKESESESADPERARLLGVFGARVRTARLRLGAERLDLMEFLAPEGRPMPVPSRSHDRWFQHAALVVRDMDEAYTHLRRHKVRHASTGPQRIPDWNEAAAGIRAFYFRDPDGHFLEAIWFPPGKGDPRWQGTHERLFLGIDHTAIAVASTEDSLRFYRDRLHLRVAGRSENHGPEQEHLNLVFGARVRITTLRAASGPGIELLEYLAPGSGRAAPADTKSNDLWHWHVDLRSEGLALPGARLVSPGPVAIGGARALLARDPDGHGLLFRERPENQDEPTR